MARNRGLSEVEVANVGRFGLWLFVHDKEHFLSYEEYPWFRDARIGDVLDVVLVHGNHLHWPSLDVDLCIESLEHPEAFPLTYRGQATAPGRRRQAQRT